MSSTISNNTGTKPKKPISARQLAANRANAKKATGPKTEAGKNRTRLNGLKHGRQATIICLTGNAQDFRQQLTQLLTHKKLPNEPSPEIEHPLTHAALAA